MLEFSDLKLNKIISLNNQPYKIISAQHSKQARSGAVLRTKLKNLISGEVLEKTFNSGDKAEEANLERIKANFLYNDENDYYFMTQESFEQFSLSKESLTDQAIFLNEGIVVDVLKFNNEPMSINLPTKMDFKVISSPPAIKGDTAGTANKQVTIETGAKIKCPLFVKQGDIIKINTETGEYVERI